MARLGTFDELVGAAEPSVEQVARELRRVILEVHPEVVEVVRLGDRAASYGLGPRKMLDGYAYLMPQAGHVNLGFYQGTSLPDPAALLEGSGASLRHVKVRSLREARRDELRELVAAALARRRAGSAV